MSEELKKLREERASVVTEMRTLHDTGKKSDKGGLTAEQQEQWDKMDARCEELDVKVSQLEKLEKLESRERHMEQSAGSYAERQRDNRGSSDDNEAPKMDEKMTFRSWMQGGMRVLSDEQRQYMQGRMDTSLDTRDLGVGATNTGGATVPEDFRNELEVAMSDWGGMMEVAEVISTDTGATLPMPSLNFTGVKAAIVGENANSGKDTSTPFSSVNLGSFTYRSLVLPISLELLQDSAFSESQFITPWSEQFGRAINEHATVGDGSGKPRGIMLDAASGKIGATGQTTTVTYDDLVDLEHSVDPAYRRNARWMFHDSTLKAIKKIKDANDLPIFVRDVSGPAASTILDYQYQINQDVTAMAASARSIAFGRLDKYKLRIVRSLTMMRLTERFADDLQVGFIGFMRADGRLLDAGTNPVKYYQNSAT